LFARLSRILGGRAGSSSRRAGRLRSDDGVSEPSPIAGFRLEDMLLPTAVVPRHLSGSAASW
jgi:hypothetical protein